jgi:hypothetical protein
MKTETVTFTSTSPGYCDDSKIHVTERLYEWNSITKQVRMVRERKWIENKIPQVDDIDQRYEGF